MKTPKLRHVQAITEYDLQNFGFFMQLHDMKVDGLSWLQIANMVWPSERPSDYKKQLKEHHKRSQWLIESGKDIMMADNPFSRQESFDMLVKQGKMKPEEREFLLSPEGQKFWPGRTKH